MKRSELKAEVYRNMARVALDRPENFEVVMRLCHNFGVLNMSAMGSGRGIIYGHLDRRMFLSFSARGGEISVAGDPGSGFRLHGTAGVDQVIETIGLTVSVWSNGEWTVRGPWVQVAEDVLTDLVRNVSVAMIGSSDNAIAEHEAVSVSRAVDVLEYWHGMK